MLIHGLAIMNALMTLAMIALNVVEMAGDCPRSCECKWKSGKESVLCVNANLTEIPKQLDSGTQVLVLTGNRLQKIGADEFSNASLLNLQKIFLSRCKLRIIDRCSFRKIINLVELDLSYNDLHSVPSHTFEFIKELRELRLNGNPIARLPNFAFRMVPRLTKLDLSECRITHVEIKAFQGLENSLEWLKLDKNKIANVKPQALVNLGNLHGLELSGNSWNCTCGLRTLREWMLRRNLPYGVPPTCRHPPRLSGKIWDKLELDEFACPPRMEAVKSRKSGEEGSNVTLSCAVEGIPEPNVRWLRKNRAIANSSGGAAGAKTKLYVVRMTKRTSNLTILGADVQDNGVYICRAENKAGRSEASVTLAVAAKPAAQIWSPRATVALGAISLLFASAVALLACCARSLRRRKSCVGHATTGRRRADGYEMKPKNPIGYNKIGDCGNRCSTDAPDDSRGAGGRSSRREELRSRTTELRDRSKTEATGTFEIRRSERADQAVWSFSGKSELGDRVSDGGLRPSPADFYVFTRDGRPACENSSGASDGDSAYARSSSSSRFLGWEALSSRPDSAGDDSAFLSPLPEKETIFPDLLELSRDEENIIDDDPVGPTARKRGGKTRRVRRESCGSESGSPLLPETVLEGGEGFCPRGVKPPLERNASLPPSPGALSQTPILDILDSSGVLAESPTALKCKSRELEMFVKEYRNLQDQLYRMKESCENPKEDNLKFREEAVFSNAVESATISKMVPPLYFEGPPFETRFPEDTDSFASFYSGANFLEEDNSIATSTGKCKSASKLGLGGSEAWWSGRNDFFRTVPNLNNSSYKS